MRNGSIEGGLLVHPVVNPKRQTKLSKLKYRMGKNHLTVDVLKDK